MSRTLLPVHERKHGRGKLHLPIIGAILKLRAWRSLRRRYFYSYR